MTAPGSAKKIITVGGEAVELKPGRGPTGECVMKPEIVAPSAGIMSTTVYGGGNGSQSLRYSYIKRSGTSMAAPMVSGAVAVLLGCDPTLSNKDVKMILKRSAVPLGIAREIQGWGRVNLKRMLEELQII